ncbi:hypothetical protein SAY87_026827 [Trapa incisa]|uniref:non-specific serine/threonine protein kinase n=1 Tax=Trapa incisa TaxID=236973 RepID=A0AAN7JME6_9MYRT|nr:hypothetical protein SAY87_026827 [Trapa incisa]
MAKPPRLHIYPFKLLCHVTFLIVLQANALALLSGEAQQLLSFKSATINPGLLPDWVSSRSPCDFAGVTCKSSFRVSAIDISFTGLSVDFTSVAAFLLPLEYLETLTLRSVNLTGKVSLPFGAKCGASLKSLDLSLNSLSGPFSSVTNLDSCTSLKHLNLSGNFLDSSVPANAGLGLTLQVLDLSYNKVSGENLVAWVVASTGCAEMVRMFLQGNRLSGEVDVSNCVKLAHLDISSNNFSATLPKLGDCSALEYLDLSSNSFHGEIGSSLSACSQLSFLNLSSNHFSGPIPSSLPTKNLQLLLLSGNGFQGEIPSSLSDACPTLLGLDLSQNNLAGTIPGSLTSCSLLQSLDVSKNNFSGELPTDTLFSGMTGLKKLSLSFNSFSGSLPDSISTLPELEFLDLSSNNLSGPIPTGLCRSPSNTLQVLYLQNNLFTGTIPASLSNCSELRSLVVSFNYLSGSIPSSLGSLYELKDMVFLLNQLEGEIPSELMYMKSLENLIFDFNYLTGVIPSGLSNCTHLNWISLSNNRLSGQIPRWIGHLPNLVILKLSNNSLSGSIPPEIGDARSLIWIDLNTNLLTGAIPPQLFLQSGKISVKHLSDKRYAYIKNDGNRDCHGAGNLLEFAGRTESLRRISTRSPCNLPRIYNGVIDPTVTFKNNGSIIFLDISYNNLSGSIPKEIGTMYYLYVLNLGHNRISGSIPPEIGELKILSILDLSNNRLEGMIPEALARCSMLTEMNLSSNFLYGPIPKMGQLWTLPNSSFLNNSGLCGIPLAPCGTDLSGASNSQHHKSHMPQASMAGTIAMGLLFSLFCIFGLVFLAMEMRRRRKMRELTSSAHDVYVESQSHSGAMNTNTNWKLTCDRESMSISLATFDKPLRKLTFADLLEATNGFDDDSLIGSGGFGDVYRAHLKDGSVVAIKKLTHVSGQGDREFMAEMETIGKIKYRNLVSLLGYCKVKEERLLVYEYMKYGSLEDVLHNKKAAGVKLDWPARRKIAVGAAKGLSFLHHSCDPHIIHRDMKSSNVLLDENLEARVSDFGMARPMSTMDTHLSVSTLAGTPGYVPPEYYQSFRCSTRGDVYSYGVVLLELLTGRRPTNSADFGDNNLVGWVKQHANLRIRDVFDPTLLREDPGLEIELLQHLKVACACLDDRPFKRPTMIQVLAMFKEIQAGSSLRSVSTVAAENRNRLGTVSMVDMSIKEVPE